MAYIIVRLREAIHMFQVNDIVLHNQTEVCQVAEIRQMPFPDGERLECYVLKPVDEDGAGTTIFVPVSDPHRLRGMLSAGEVRNLLNVPAKPMPWTENAILRRKQFADVMSRSNPEELISMIRLLQSRRDERLRAGQRPSDADEKLLAAAVKRLYPLFRHALNVEWEEFGAMLSDQTV